MSLLIGLVIALALGWSELDLGPCAKRMPGGKIRLRARAKHVRAFCENSITHTYLYGH